MKEFKIKKNANIAARIDKDIDSSSIFETLFDDSNYIRQKENVVGFVGGYATAIGYYYNVMEVKMVHLSVGDLADDCIWASTIVARLTGNPYKEFDFNKDRILLCFLDDAENDPSKQVIRNFTIYCKSVRVETYFNIPRKQQSPSGTLVHIGSDK